MRVTTPTTASGMLDAGRDVVGPVLLGAWDAFLAAARACDLHRPTRLPGWRAQEVCTHLGVWDDYDAVAGLVASARAGGQGGTPDVDAANARVIAAHRHAPREEVLAALRRHRDGVRAYLADAPAGLDRAPTAGPVGALPLLTTLLAEAYELAVHALDLRTAGAGDPPDALLDAGLLALADVTGAPGRRARRGGRRGARGPRRRVALHLGRPGLAGRPGGPRRPRRRARGQR